MINNKKILASTKEFGGPQPEVDSAGLIASPQVKLGGFGLSGGGPHLKSPLLKQSLKGLAFEGIKLTEDWRLIQFLSKIEAYQGQLNFGPGSDEEKFRKFKSENLKNYGNRVGIKRYNIIDPLKADYQLAGQSINEACMENTKSTTTPPWLMNTRRFPISAHFLASWICENIRNSKSYRLVFLFEKIAKELFDNTSITDKKFVISLPGKDSLISSGKSLVCSENYRGRLAMYRNLLSAPSEEDSSRSISQKHLEDLRGPSSASSESFNLHSGGFKPSSAWIENGESSTKSSRILKQKLIGLKIVVSGRILGAEIARIQSFKRGQTPGNTISVIKDKAQVTAKTKTGTLGINLTLYWR
jgi:hypothetical protein